MEEAGQCDERVLLGLEQGCCAPWEREWSGGAEENPNLE